MLKSFEASEGEISEAGLLYRVSVPEGCEEGAPLAVLVHGRTGDANVMWTFSKVVAGLKCVTVAPQGFLKDQLGGWSWWNIDAPDPTNSARVGVKSDALINAKDRLSHFINWCVKHYRCDSKRVLAIGFSQGGALIASTSLMQPDLFAGVALLASFVPKAVFDADLMDKGIREHQKSLPPYFFANGNRDEIIEIAWARAGADRLRELGADVEFMEDDVGHKVGSSSLKALEGWIAQKIKKP